MKGLRSEITQYHHPDSDEGDADEGREKDAPGIEMAVDEIDPHREQQNKDGRHEIRCDAQQNSSLKCGFFAGLVTRDMADDERRYQYQ